jgi:CubicO group peptidase (beta-lactamase class C family)
MSENRGIRTDSTRPASRRLFTSALAVSTALLATAGVGCAAQEDADYGEFGARLERFVEEAMALDASPGIVIGVVRGDETLYLGGFGYADLETRRPVTPETVFYIASSTKSFTGMAGAILHERGELDLDASLADYIPGVRLGGDLDPASITLRDLMTHTHGIENTGPVTFRLAFSGDHTHDQLVALLAAHGAADSGRDFEYGNIGFNVAALAMDEELGVHWKDVLEREIFAPLGMRSTSGYISRFDESRLAMPYGFEPDGWARLNYTKHDSNMQSAGGLVTTAVDATRWLRAQLNDGRLGGEQILDEHAVAAAHYPYAEQDDSYFSFQRTGYGLGWNTGSYDGEPFTHHFGGFSGFHSHISFMPEHDVGVAIFLNTSAAPLADLVARYIYDSLRGVPDVEQKYQDELERSQGAVEGARERVRADRERRASRPQDLPHPLESYAGEFHNEELGTMEFRVVDGHLEATMGHMQSAVEVYDRDQNMLRVELTGGGSVVPFVFEAGNDSAVALQWMSRRFDRVSP